MKDIKGYERVYAITKNGKVWRYPRAIIKNCKNGKRKKFNFIGKWLKSHTTKSGNWYYSICLGGRKNRKGFKIHRLVAQTYIPNPKNLPEVNHKNGNKGDNRIKNLEWCTRQYNIKYSLKILPIKDRNLRRGQENYWAKLTPAKIKYIKKFYKPFDKKFSGRKLAKKFGVSAPTIQGVIAQRYWQHIK